MVALKPNCSSSARNQKDGPPVIMSLPICMSDIVTIAPASRLRCVNASAEGDGVGRCDNLCIGKAK